jgi:capsular polysaccharide biosynthesis protein
MLGIGRRRRRLTHLLRHLPGDLADRSRGSLVVIAESATRLAELRSADYAAPEARLIELVGSDVETMRRELSTYAGSGMLVVDTRPSFGWDQLNAFSELFFHLDKGDVWVALRSRHVPRGRKERLAALAARFDTHGAGRLPVRWKEHRRSVASCAVSPRMVFFEKGRDHLLKVRDDSATELLNAREPALRVSELTVLPAGTLVARGSLSDHGTAPEPRFPSLLEYPEARLRRYEGPVSLPAISLALHGRSVLPDSFRWHRNEHPVNNGLLDVDEWFARAKPDQSAGERLSGSYYFFWYNHPGHFGHLTTEGFSKLWGWDAAKVENPDLKLLCREHPRRRGTAHRLENVLLPAYGIDLDDVVWAPGPVTVDDLVGATPLWHNAPPYYVHPALRQEWRRLRQGLPRATVPSQPKIFVTRKPGWNRTCHNGHEVEALFTRHGFAIVRPETLTIPEQAALFAQARVVAGYGGSGMFNLMYAERLEHVVVLNQSAYWGRSEHLFATALGADQHVFWSQPDPGPEEGTYEAHQSDWEFDWARNGEALETLLADL